MAARTRIGRRSRAGRGWTKSQAVRAAIRALTRPAAEDPLLDLSGDLDGLPGDLSARIDRYLDETYVAERPAPYRSASAPPGRLFVDSGAWIALRNRRDQYHAEADRLIRAAVEARTALLTTTLVLAETHRVTLFRVGVRAPCAGSSASTPARA